MHTHHAHTHITHTHIAHAHGAGPGLGQRALSAHPVIPTARCLHADDYSVRAWPRAGPGSRRLSRGPRRQAWASAGAGQLAVRPDGALTGSGGLSAAWASLFLPRSCADAGAAVGSPWTPAEARISSWGAEEAITDAAPWASPCRPWSRNLHLDKVPGRRRLSVESEEQAPAQGRGCVSCLSFTSRLYREALHLPGCRLRAELRHDAPQKRSTQLSCLPP